MRCNKMVEEQPKEEDKVQVVSMETLIYNTLVELRDIQYETYLLLKEWAGDKKVKP